MRRKRYQRGSVNPRKRIGKTYWYAQWREDGKPRSKELGLCSTMTRAQAEGILSGILQPINEASGRGRMPRVNHTFGQFVEQVYIPVCLGKWKVSTAMTEVDRIKFHLVSALGGLAIAAITREELQTLLNTKAVSLSRSVVDHLRFRLRSIFEMAMSEGVVDRNPATTLYSPKHCAPGRERRVLTADDFTKMISVLDLREKVIVRLATIEGMRPGEILGLQLGDVELAADRLWIRRRIYRGNVDIPKNERSARDVALSLGTLALMEAWVDRLILSGPEDWVFQTEKPRAPLQRNNAWVRYLLPRLEPIGLEWATFQVMRRTFASRSKEAGVDAHTRSAQMGQYCGCKRERICSQRLQDSPGGGQEVRDHLRSVTLWESSRFLRLSMTGATRGN
jgi:integrase